MALPTVLSITTAMLVDKITLAGLDDAQVFEAVGFVDLDDMIISLFPGISVNLEPDAEVYAKILLVTAATRADFSRRLEDDGLPGGLSDSLWAAGVAREKARKAEMAGPAEASVDLLGRGPAVKRQGPVSWRPVKRAKPTGSLASLDVALTNTWGGRLAQALQGTPAADMANDSGDSASFFVSLVGKARPSTV